MNSDTLRPFPPGARAEADGSFSMCSKKTNCPRLSEAQDGGVVITGDDGATIPFADDQLAVLEEFLAWRRQQRG